MRIPKGIDIYRRRKKLKTGSECPKELEKQLQIAIDMRKKILERTKKVEPKIVSKKKEKDN